ncbi:hypothetical protein T11_3762, partial [Trichinella zimbabwensis]
MTFFKFAEGQLQESDLLPFMNVNEEKLVTQRSKTLHEAAHFQYTFYSSVKNVASTEKYASRFCFEEVTDVQVSY